MMTWDDILRDEMQQPYFQQLLATVQQERDNGQMIYPAPDDVFNAFAYTPLERVKVVILGQDPYHNEQQAHGLAFSGGRVALFRLL